MGTTDHTPRKVGWMGSSKEDLKAMPDEVQDHVGFVLRKAQDGEAHPSMKQLKGMSGVYEIKVDFDTDAYRAVYVVKFKDAIWVLHVFQKKSHKGDEVPKLDKATIARRLKDLEARMKAG